MTLLLLKPEDRDHWSSNYVGLSPRDPLSPCHVDLVRHVYLGELGLRLPKYSAGSGWKPVVDDPQELDLVTFTEGGVVAHVGVVADAVARRMVHLPEGELASRIDSFEAPNVTLYRRKPIIEAISGSRPVVTDGIAVIPLPYVNPESAEVIFLPGGQTLAEMIEFLYPLTSPMQRSRMRVMIGLPGDPPDRWVEYRYPSFATAKPHAGLVVAIAPLPGAIHWGAIIGLTALAAALALGQWYLGPLLATTIFANTLGTLAISSALMAASLLVSDLRAGQKQQAGGDRGGHAATGWNNEARPWGLLPDPDGKTRAAPPYAAMPYITLGPSIPAETFTWRYRYTSGTANVDPGSGNFRLSGFGGDHFEVAIDNLDVNGANHAAQFLAWSTDTSVVRNITLNEDANNYLGGHITAVTVHSGWALLEIFYTGTTGDPHFTQNELLSIHIWTTETTGDLDTIYLHGLFLEAIGDGVITERRFGDTPIDKFDQGNATPIVVEQQLIAPGDPWPFKNYPQTIVPVDASTMGAEFAKETSDWVVRMLPRDCTEFDVMLSFPGGLFEINDASGNPESASVRFQWAIAPAGVDIKDYPTGWTPLTGWSEVQAKKLKPFFRSFQWQLPDRNKTWQVAFKKTGDSGDLDDGSSQATFIWASVQGHRPEAPFTCRTTVLASAFRVRSTGQLQGTIEAYNRIFSRKANYWNGTHWVLGETAQPAAAFRRHLQSGSLALPYPNSDLNLVSLQDWADYTTPLGLEYHSTGADQPERLEENQNRIANSARARARRYNLWEVVVDKPDGVVAGFISPRNGWQVSVTTQRTPAADGFSVSFMDETADYATRTRIVPFPGFSEKPGLTNSVKQLIAIELPGITDPASIYREAMRLYYIQFVMRLPLYSATAGPDHLTYGAGQRLKLDDGTDQSRTTVLATAVLGDVVYIDAEVTMDGSKLYEAVFRHLPAEGAETDASPPAQTLTKRVQTVPGRSKRLVFYGAGLTPAVNDLIMFGEVGKSSIDVVVQEAAGGPDFTSRLTLYPYTPTLDATINALVVPPWTGRVGDPVPGNGADNETEGGSVELIFISVLFEVGENITSFASVRWETMSGATTKMRWRAVAATSSGGGFSDGFDAGFTNGVVNPPAATVSTVADLSGNAVAVTGALSQFVDYEVSVLTFAGTWSNWTRVPDITLVRNDADTLLRNDSVYLERA